jgi:RNA polymerase sigma-70 factor (ECF subfamily)
MKRAPIGELDPIMIERARRGDTDAFARMVEHYQGPVYNLAFRMLGDAAEAEDAAQETFLRAYAQFGAYRPDRKFVTWLLSIAAHYCIDRLRRRKFQWLSLDEANVQETIPTPTPGPEDLAFAREREEEVRTLLQKLTPASRTVVVLKYWNDLDIEDIAQITGESASAVKVKLFRARQMMAREMRERMRREGALPRGLEGAVGHARG